MPPSSLFRVDSLLTDNEGRVITRNDDTAINVDWFLWDRKPESFVEAYIGGSWVGLECDVRSMTCNMGRELTDQPVEAGVATIVIDNRSGIYTDWQDERPPINESTAIRIKVRHPSLLSDIGEQIIWFGWAESFFQTWTRNDDEVTVTAVDSIAVLSEIGGALGWTSGSLNDNVPQRLEHLLARVGMAYSVSVRRARRSLTHQP